MSIISIIAAVANDQAIGKGQQLLCHLPADLKHFKSLTTGHAIIMGRKTFESLPKGALPHRTNIVLTTQNHVQYDGCLIAKSVEEAFQLAKDDDEIFIIGGATLYEQTIDKADRLYITRIYETFPDADVFFPTIDPNQWSMTTEERHETTEGHPYAFTFQTFERRE